MSFNVKQIKMYQYLFFDLTIFQMFFCYFRRICRFFLEYVSACIYRLTCERVSRGSPPSSWLIRHVSDYLFILMDVVQYIILLFRRVWFFSFAFMNYDSFTCNRMLLGVGVTSSTAQEVSHRPPREDRIQVESKREV